MEKQDKFDHFFKTRLLSFRYAFQGIRYLIQTQRNAWIHTLATVVCNQLRDFFAFEQNGLGD